MSPRLLVRHSQQVCGTRIGSASPYAELQKKFWAAGNLGAMAWLRCPGRDNVFRMLVEDGIRAPRKYHEGHLTEQDCRSNEWITVALYIAPWRAVSMRAGQRPSRSSPRPDRSHRSSGCWGRSGVSTMRLTRISIERPGKHPRRLRAPIGEALIMTAIGLFVARAGPSMGYNWLFAAGPGKQEHPGEDEVSFTADLHSYLVGGGAALRHRPTPFCCGQWRPAGARLQNPCDCVSYGMWLAHRSLEDKPKLQFSRRLARPRSAPGTWDSARSTSFGCIGRPDFRGRRNKLHFRARSASSDSARRPRRGFAGSHGAPASRPG